MSYPPLGSPDKAVRSSSRTAIDAVEHVKEEQPPIDLNAALYSSMEGVAGLDKHWCNLFQFYQQISGHLSGTQIKQEVVQVLITQGIKSSSTTLWTQGVQIFSLIRRPKESWAISKLTPQCH